MAGERATVGGMHPPQPYAEQLLHQDPAATVTTARFMVSGATYPIRGITAVQYAELPKDHTPTGLAAFGVFVAAVYAVVKWDLPPLAFLAAPVLTVVVAALVANQVPTHYVVRILTAGGQVEALRTTSKAQSGAVVAALNRAIAGV